MFPILQVGPAAIPVAPLVLLIGIFVSASVVEKFAAQRGLDSNALSNALYLGLGAALVGARLGYVAGHPAAYWSDPLSVLVPTPAALDSLVGIAAGIAVGVLYGYRYRLPLWRTLDALAPGIAVLALALGLSHLASGDAFGAPARLPWSIYLWDDYRHPSQVYEVIAALVLVAACRVLARTRTFDGFLFWSLVGLQAAGIIILEAFRGDSILFQGWRIVQVLGLGALAFALVALRTLSQRASISNSNRESQS